MAGRVISRANMAHIQEIYQRAKKLGGRDPDAADAKADSLLEHVEAVRCAAYRLIVDDMRTPYVEDILDGGMVILELCDAYWRASYTTAADGAVTIAERATWEAVEQVWQAAVATVKGDGLHSAEPVPVVYATMKALGDRQIEVKVAYGGHNRGKDSHGEYFSARTDFDPEHFPAPPLLYYHGFDEAGRKMGKPAVTGKMVSRRAEADGHVLVYQLKAGTYADRQWDAALKGACAVSPGTVGHLIRKATDGELLYWPLAEVSAWDGAPNRKQANLYSVAAPVLKAHYLEAGIPIPSPLNETPEAAGNAAGAVTDTDPTVAGQVIAAEVAAALLALRSKEPAS